MLKFADYSKLDKIFEWDKVQGIFLDIDDTLYNYNVCHEYALKSCYKKLSPKIKKIKNQNKFFAEYKNYRKQISTEKKNNGLCRSRYLAFLYFLDNISFKNNFKDALILEDIYWDKFISKIRPHKGLKKFLLKCKKKGIEVCAITDMQIRFQIKKIIKLGINEYIDNIVSSEEAGCEKPNLNIFKLAYCKMSCNKKTIVMIGDNYKKDILGAKRFGIKSYQLKL